jgi:hypothetical protein
MLPAAKPGFADCRAGTARAAMPVIAVSKDAQMLDRTLQVAVVLATVLAAAAPMPAAAQVNAQIAINVGPPPLRAEFRPGPRRNMIWTPGYWDWRHGHHVWVPGAWVRARPGYHWVEPHWVSHGGRWILVRGHWDDVRHRGPRDSDRDGVPNRYDRDRDNDGVRNRVDRDRDGDGVPNRHDRRPDNPRRY